MDRLKQSNSESRTLDSNTTTTDKAPLEEQASEYSETISILSFSDTDDELQEIEKKSYLQGVAGKDEAYKDIEEVFDELEDEKLLDPFTRWRPKQDPDEIASRRGSKFVPKRPIAMPRRIPEDPRAILSTKQVKSPKPSQNSGQSSSRISDQGKLGSSSQRLPDIQNLSSGSAPSLASIHSSLKEVKETKGGLKINKVSDSLSSPRKQLMVELIMEATQEKKKKKAPPVQNERKPWGQVYKESRTEVTNSGEPNQTQLVPVNRNPPYSVPPRGYYLNESESDRHRKMTRQEELIQELAQSKDAKSKNRGLDEFSFDQEEGSMGYYSGSRKDPADRTVYKIQYKEPRWPHQVTLDKMVDRLYRVKMLILDESELKSLRDISSLLPSLLVLSVKSCGLKTLDGTLAFPNLQKLCASDNLLTHPAQCSLLPELQELDLSGNPIESFEGFDFLSVLLFLRVIKLYDTKVTEDRTFHSGLRKLIPSLRDIYPKAKSVHYDFNLEDDDYLDVDYQLLGKTETDVAEEQHNLKKSGQSTTMTTHMITNTTTPPCSAPSVVSSTRQWSRRSQIQTPETMDGSVITADGDIRPNSGVTSIEASESEVEAAVEIPGGDAKPCLTHLKHIYQYVNSANPHAGPGDGDDGGPQQQSGGDLPTSEVNSNISSHSQRVSTGSKLGKSDGDNVLWDLDDELEFDIESMDCNSSHWSAIEEEELDLKGQGHEAGEGHVKSFHDHERRHADGVGDEKIKVEIDERGEQVGKDANK